MPRDHDFTLQIPTRRRNYTTGELAKLLLVSPRTVSSWIDSGQLRGYRIGKSDRRVTHANLVKFAASRGIPLWEKSASTVVFLGFDTKSLLNPNAQGATLRALRDIHEKRNCEQHWLYALNAVHGGYLLSTYAADFAVFILEEFFYDSLLCILRSLRDVPDSTVVPFKMMKIVVLFSPENWLAHENFLQRCIDEGIDIYECMQTTEVHELYELLHAEDGTVI